MTNHHETAERIVKQIIFNIEHSSQMGYADGIKWKDLFNYFAMFEIEKSLTQAHEEGRKEMREEWHLALKKSELVITHNSPEKVCDTLKHREESIKAIEREKCLKIVETHYDRLESKESYCAADGHDCMYEIAQKIRELNS